MQQIYDVDFFLKKFEAIPEEKWCTNAFTDGENHCAVGHCGMTNVETAGNLEAVGLMKVFNKIYYSEIFLINDGENEKYQQPTPKQRILAALRDIKAMQSKEQEVKECDARKDDSSNSAGTIKIVTKYVAVSETISKELVLN